MKPIIALTMGDAAGVGPEIIVKAMADTEIRDIATLFVIGDRRRLQQAIDIVASPLSINAIAGPSEVSDHKDTIDVLDIPAIPDDLAWGQLSATAGHGAFLFIEKAVELAMAGSIDAICTGPLNKEALHLGGHAYPGHTEMLAALAGVEEVSMMLTAPKMRVIHVTTHLGLIDAIAKIDGDRVYRTITRGNNLLVKAGIPRPRIAVAAINPHAGEGGLFGNGEEAEKIEPGVARAQADGLDVLGPLPADTLFYRAGRGDFDLVVAQYHDQGHIPVKVLGLKNGVNVTVGLPFVRTSVDHGTAFDIAGKNIVDHEPLLEAIRQAADLSPERNTDN
ncbi:4-hydroxythreonine-4-phosphate dehydrogenase PdxA [Subtercola vilae]|uniref:4-hydroxythreonine-4-phosphate dehydrogenase PdxA n=1 Tax=Subtercola vilae TaxID=2056433 RepID=A0A4T2BBQ6_9MICO|nr:4-hydroxythreonine-4-phosphate dehydrogenase PdxA [Subtercola vilae]TIH28615.1 4-hydroxythreonine-4-phosphate dehydrogenase PdxA [Subtercola vilae]